MMHHPPLQVPYFIFGIVPFHWLTFNRFGAWFLPAFYNAAPDGLSKPLKAAWWAFVAFAIKHTLGCAHNSLFSTCFAFPQPDIC